MAGPALPGFGPTGTRLAFASPWGDHGLLGSGGHGKSPCSGDCGLRGSSDRGKSPRSGDRGFLGSLGIGSSFSSRHEASAAHCHRRAGALQSPPRSQEPPSFGYHGFAGAGAAYPGRAAIGLGSSGGGDPGRRTLFPDALRGELGSSGGDPGHRTLFPDALPGELGSGVQGCRGLQASLGGSGGGQVRDAEMSVEFLCRKFETLSDVLRREEAARESAERRSRELNAEVQIAEDSIARDHSAFAVELKASDSSLAALRANADGAGHLAAARAERVREEYAANSRLEQRCVQLAEECRSEVARVDSASAKLAAQEREAVQEQCEHGELTRRLRQVQADMQVSLEDLRIAKKRAMLVNDENQSLERSLEAARSQSHSTSNEYDAHAALLAERHRHFSELEVRLKELSESVDVTRSDNMSRDRRLATMQGDDKASQAQLMSVQQEVAALKHEQHARSAEVQAESEVHTILQKELEVMELQRLNEAQEASAYLKKVAEATAALGALQQDVEEAHATRQSLSRHLEQLTVDEQHHAAAARGLSQTRHAEDVAFEDVQSELQAAFRRKDALADDLAVHRRGRDALLERLRRLQPEIGEADERCRHLELQLASRAQDIEEELVQQRHSQEEVAALASARRRLQRQESEFEAECHLMNSAKCSQGPEGSRWRSRSAAGPPSPGPRPGSSFARAHR